MGLMRKPTLCWIIIIAFFYLSLITEGPGGTVAQIKIDPVAEMIKLPQEDWLSLSLMGAKVGYAHIYAEKVTYRDQPAIKIRTQTAIQIQRTGTGLRLETTRTCYVGLDLVPLYFVSLSNETGQEKRVEGVIENGEIRLETTLAGETTTVQKSVAPNTVFDAAVGYFVLHHGFEVGDQYDLNVFSMDLMQPVETEIKVVRQETVNGQPTFVVDYTMDIMGGITTTEWVDVNGTTHRMESGLMGLKMVLTRTDMSTALDGLTEVDVILKTKILSTGERPKPDANRLLARVQIFSLDPEKAILRNHRQKILSQNGTDLRLEISREPKIPSLARSVLATRVQQDQTLAGFLESSVYIQADHPQMIEQAKAVVSDENQAWPAADKLNRWVYDTIRNKNLQVGFGSALQTLESQTGDCTEHTVLFVALARAAGLPARVCAGLVFQRDAFYYHFWSEVYVGEWIATDPTFGQAQADATHIQLAGSVMESDSMVEMGEGVMRTLNQMEIEILESQ